MVDVKTFLRVFSEGKTADRPMMGHSMQRASSYQVTRLGELGEPEPWTGKSVTSQSRGTTGV
jgi:hypothetical protein